MKRKIKFLSLVFILIISLLVISVNAADMSFTTTMTPSSTTVSEASEITVTVSVSNLNVGDNGINSFSAYLAYDADVFETLTDSSVEGLNSWSATYSTTSAQILLTKNSFVNSEEDIMQITLKVKEGVEDGTNGTVSLSGIVVSNSEDDIDGDNVSTTITVGTSSSSGSSNTIKIEVESSNNTTTDNSTEENTSNTDNNTSVYNISNSSDDDSDIPYTGTFGDAFVKIILGVVLVALVIYIKIRKMDEIK